MSNFKFLDSKFPELAQIGAQAEEYVFSDPQASLIKLRCLAEKIVDFIYEHLELSVFGEDNFFSRITNYDFESAIDRPIIDKLHAIRINGNKAAHKDTVTSEESGWLLKEGYLLSRWFYTTLNPNSTDTINDFIEPSCTNHDGVLKANEVLKDKIEQQSLELKNALFELEKMQKGKFAGNAVGKPSAGVNKEKLEEFRHSGINATHRFDLEEEETKKRVTLEDIYAEYSLTDSQKLLVEKLNDFLKSKNQNVFLLRGYAGTGKTFITKGLTEYFKAIGRSYCLAAPTGKAAKVISNKTKSLAHTIHKTIYSFKDIKEFKIDDLLGSETYKLYAELKVNEDSADTVYIFDEASMISDVYQEAEFFRFGSGYLLKDVFKYINLDHNDHNKKIIFIGDFAQLPPVGMADSPALNEDYLQDNFNVTISSYDLKEVVRQKENSGILKNAVNIRKSIESSLFNELDFDLSSSDIEHIEYNDLISKYLEICEGGINDNAMVIAYSNDDVYKYNERIRNEFYPGSECVEVGDRLLIVQNTNIGGHFISNGDFATVVWAAEENVSRRIKLKEKESNGNVVETEVPINFREVVLEFVDNENKKHRAKTYLYESLLYSGKPNLNSDEKKALYVDFKIRNPELKSGTLEFKETLRSDPFYNALKAKFGYAITCHKSQGSEWKNVFVKCKSNKNTNSVDYFKWLYTAITRASENLFVLDEPHFKPWSGLKKVGASNTNGTSVENIISEEVKGENQQIDIKTYLLEEVQALIQGTNIVIENIEHHQYLERYLFKKENDSVTFDFTYNSKDEISTVRNKETNDLSKILNEILAVLKGKLLCVKDVCDDKDQEEEFSKPFLKNFHENIKEVLASDNIDIIDVKALNYSQRYTFVRDKEKAVIDIFYNDKQQFTKFNSLSSKSNSEDFVLELENILSEKL
jgi:hypothetical protein